MKLSYQRADKHVTTKDFFIKTEIKPKQTATLGKIKLTIEGVLLIDRGFRWNGANGIPDAKVFMRGSCVHDALYKLIENNLLPDSEKRKADHIMAQCFHEDGLPKPIAKLAYCLVKAFGGFFIK